ncbi:MAG TPA: CRTAC1 family protein [Chloroflexota bacterium]|nr:CRTAC1 family protein [Chloroflexota bacterium]
MCFSPAGRVQTRLAALLPALLLAIALTWITGDQRYLTMLVTMTLVALDLDILLYPHLITYQPRWLTYLLGLAEFFIILAVVRWLAGTLPLGSIIAFYAASWIAGYLTVHTILPTLDPMWAEHGGEIGRSSVTTGLGRGLVARVRDLLAAPSGDALMIVALLLVAALALLALPVTATPADIAVSLAGAMLAALVGRRLDWAGSAGWGTAVILGLLVPLLLRNPDPLVFLAAGACAVLLASGPRVAGQALLNPAAATLVLFVLLVPGTYTSDAQWGNSVLLLLILANLGLFLAARRGLAPEAAGFGLVLAGWVVLQSPHQPQSVLLTLPQLLPTAIVFFGGFVLPDPATSPHGAARQGAFGAAVAVLGLALRSDGIGLPFVVALLIANEVWAVISLLGRRRVSPSRPGALLTRRSFLRAGAAAAGALFLGASVRRLGQVDPALLALPADAAFAGGRNVPHFTNVVAAAGIAASHHGDPSERSPAIGTGVAWGDYDGDGRLDLYVTDHMAPSHLYRNNGDGTFTDVAHDAGVANPGRATSATFVDYDNDGRLDLYVGVAYGPNRLYHNNGDGTFTDVTDDSGLGDPGRTMSTVWADYDGDGYLDVFVANYTVSPIAFTPNTTPLENLRTVSHVPRPTNRLYHNNGDGTFTDVTHLLGFDETRGLGFSAVWFDYNNDGRPDLYVCYDFGEIVRPNTLWRNDGPGPDGWRFTPVQTELGVATQANPMGVASGDYLGNGWLDLAVSNIGPNMLYTNRHGTGFTDRAEAAGVTHRNVVVDNALDPSMTWGTTFADLNNDGWQDLYIVAGAMDFENVPQPNLVYLNNGHGGFIDVSAPSGANDPGQGRSVAVGDYDGDGRLDLFVANYGQPPLLYRSVGPDAGHHWVRLQLEGTRSNRDAVGARVTLRCDGLPPQTQEVQIGQGLGSCNDRALHFGLGKAAGVSSVEIRWPSGARQALRGLQVDRVHRLREPGPSRWT